MAFHIHITLTATVYFALFKGRDSIHRKHYSLTDEVDPQWKQVLKDLDVHITYALSPQAKGKIKEAIRMAAG
jgi:hypothetical protein